MLYTSENYPLGEIFGIGRGFLLAYDRLYIELKRPTENVFRTVAYRIKDAFLQNPDLVIINKIGLPFNFHAAEVVYLGRNKKRTVCNRI